MANTLCEVSLTRSRIERARKSPESAGAVVEFWGMVRPLEQNREIEGIYYEANEGMAEHQLRQIAGCALSQFNLESVAIDHRLGFVPVHEASVFVRVTSRHRGAAFDGNRWIMEELKNKVPIWKRFQFKEPATQRAEREQHPVAIER